MVAEVPAAQFNLHEWADRESEVTRRVVEKTQNVLNAYREDPVLVEEHANIERFTAQGGYGQRQIYELIQNGADELISDPGGKIHLLLTEDTLYCANEGTPITVRGVDAVLSASLSVKRKNEIGRFGLGFKSVLGVTDMPDFFSRSGSFRFDPEFSESKVREVVPEARHTPILRTAYPLRATGAAEHDPTLSGLMAWATTVVRLPVNRERADWLPAHIRDFPAEFLVFSPHVGILILEDSVEKVRREIRLSKDGAIYHLHDGPDVSSWRVFERIHRPSERAREVAGELADRDELPLIWAVPTDGRRRAERGTFWAFFPTHYVTTLRGILNAPWKTNQDRQNLLEGTFNEELLAAASELVVDALPELPSNEDPAAHLDVMPARGREAPNWADALITDSVYRLAAARPSLPDQTGRLRLPSELSIHPADVGRQAADAWHAFPRRPVVWCHPTVETRDRRPRAERLIEAAGGQIAAMHAWLEALCEDGSPDASIAALSTSRLILDLDDPRSSRHLATAEIVLTEDGDWVAPAPTVFLPSDYRPTGESLRYVHPDVAADPVAKSVLEELGVREADPLAELEAFTRQDSSSLDDEQWQAFWRLASSVDPDDAARIIRAAQRRFRVHGRSALERFRPIGDLLLPGPIIPEGAHRDQELVIDVRFHQGHLEFLRALGVGSVPQRKESGRDEPWFGRYLQASRREYLKQLDEVRSSMTGNLQQPQIDRLGVVEGPFAGPLAPLALLSEEGRAAFTAALLTTEDLFAPWRMRHSTRSDYYPALEVPSATTWMVKREGRLKTSTGIVPVPNAVGPSLTAWSKVLPVASELDDEASAALGVANRPEDIRDDVWDTSYGAAQLLHDDQLLGRFWAFACRFGPKPDRVVCRVGDAHHPEPTENVTVVGDRRALEALASEGTPALFVADPHDARILIETWGLAPGEGRVRTEIAHVPSSIDVPLADRWPLLAAALPTDQRDLRLAPCEWLKVVTLTDTGRTSEPIELHFDETARVLYFDDDIEEHSLLTRISDLLDLGLTEEEIQEVVRHRTDEDRRRRAREVAAEDDAATRLLALLDAETIRRRLSPPLIGSAEKIHGPADDDLIARLAHATYGVHVLREFKSELSAAGWGPPMIWAGSQRAREWVDELGFGPEYAGFAEARRDPLLMVDGPIVLPVLHPYQQQLSAEIRRLVRGDGGLRGLLSLPTGAGKTRVVVESLVDAIRGGDLRSPILWVAQTDELCEQAVQSWREVWRSLGPSAPLHISRLWSTNEAIPVEGGTQVVVATIAKLEVCFDKPVYDWLRTSACIVVDEAHASITTAYTRLLDWLGMARGRERAPLIGLTATPFRGTSEEETRRLVARYGRRRLDQGILGEEPYAALQELGVLAKVEHELLPGSAVDLTPAERKQLSTLRRLPAAVEERIGADSERNMTLLDHIRSLPDDWTVLLFAASVEHARTMAALLSLADVPAAAVSAETEPGARRHYVEEFRVGRLRVLTNYGVLTQGFDAPAVRAVYVARPTFSPNLYQQMIGRGLRGPLNGGKDVCLIVNVADNFLQYGESLAFTQFEYLWNPSGADGVGTQ